MRLSALFSGLARRFVVPILEWVLTAYAVTTGIPRGSFPVIALKVSVVSHVSEVGQSVVIRGLSLGGA
uniref:Uncharacterized protein n=1 Tax=Phakopsora pachyrhizi TaxID=170000 RepID=A0A0S1MK56_PHAPC